MIDLNAESDLRLLHIVLEAFYSCIWFVAQLDLRLATEYIYVRSS